MVDAAKACNDKYEIAILDKSTPPLLLVPQTYARKDSLFLINDLIAACNHLRVKRLHFTHIDSFYITFENLHCIKKYNFLALQTTSLHTPWATRKERTCRGNGLWRREG
jgi:hypothetical protein